MPYPHVDATIAALSEDWFFGPTVGPKYGQRLTKEFAGRGDKQAVDDTLGLGNYLIHTQSNKRQRHALRAVLLANLLITNQPVAVIPRIREQYNSSSLEDLKQQFAHLFPAFFDDNNRATWNPLNFTNPNLLSALQRPTNWTNKAVPLYKFFVHTLKHPSAVLDTPISMLSGWTAISMSVLASRKPIAYSNHGLILHVPENNVLTASPTDQWFDNYAGTKQSVKAAGQSMAKHIAEKNLMIGGLLTPDQVVDRQGTAEAMQHFAGAAQTQHNEVVVCGLPNQPLPHGMTGQLRLLGVFIQTRMDGTLPDHYVKSQGQAKKIELAVAACAKNYHVPLLYLPTPNLP